MEQVCKNYSALDFIIFSPLAENVLVNAENIVYNK